MAVVTAAQSPSRIIPPKASLFFFVLIESLFFSTSICLPQTAVKLLTSVQKCDQLYSQRADSVKAAEAATCYEDAFAQSPKAEIAIRLGKNYYWLGAHAVKDKQIDLFQKGIDWSKKAIEINPKNPGGYFWLGVNNSKYGEARGILKSLFLVGPIIDSMQQVIAIDPGYDHGGAYRVLGRVYFKLPRFAGGGIDKSIENLKKSLEYGPNVSTTHLFLAESYMAKKEYQLTQQELNIIINTPAMPGLEPEFNADKKEARLLLAEVKKKLED
jgi:tetratricopeptide (TPR) repeat protein